jgi:hypothetical protein
MDAKKVLLCESVMERDMASDRTKPRMAILSEFAYARLTEPYREGDRSLPAGAKGTVLSVFPKTKTYTIEFFEPVRCVETVPMKIVAELDA